VSAGRLYKRPLLMVVAILSLGLSALVIVSVGMAIYPGAMKWTAPMLCPSDQPDAHVVRTTVTDTEGTSTSFSLLCMGERGDFSEAGTWEPYFLLMLWTWSALVVLSVLIYIRFIVRYRRKAAAGPTPGPTDRPGLSGPQDAPVS
jgi:hypothetical protein